MWMPEYRIDFGGAIAGHGQFSTTSNVDGESRSFAYSIDDNVLNGLVAGNVPSTLIDLADILRAIPLVDRRTRRTWSGDPRPSEQRWPRRLIIPFPVRELDFWKSSPAGTLLSRLIWHLSGDQLEPSFSPIVEQRGTNEAQLRLPICLSERIDAVTLVSGGLDSAFGLIKRTGEDSSSRALAISVHSHLRQVEVQSRIVSALSLPEPYGKARRVSHLPVSISLTPELKDRESSYKTRALLFLSAGVLAAAGAGLDRLTVAENGPGALNLPSNATLGGPQLNRAMHPTTLRMVSELVSLALGRLFLIENIGFRFTKRQMVSAMRDAGFGDLLGRTVSCDRFPYTAADTHCGRCSSCLLRALAAVDMPTLFDRLGPPDLLRGRRLALMSRSIAFAHLRMLGWRLDEVLSSDNPLECLWVLDQYIKDARSVLDDPELLTMLGSFRQDIAELEELIDGVRVDRDSRSTERLAAISGSYQ